jgi:hypothetical protein
VIVSATFLLHANIIFAKTVSILAAFNLFAHEISATFNIVANAFGFVAQLMIAAVLVVFAFSFGTNIIQAAFYRFFIFQENF